MIRAAVLAAAVALFSSCVVASDVLDLHKDDFHTTIAPEELVLVEFFARESLVQRVAALITEPRWVS